MKENTLLARYERDKDMQEWIRTRNIEFAVYSSTFGPNGKKVFTRYKQPKDLYPLEADVKEKPLTGQAAITALNKLTK